MGAFLAGQPCLSMPIIDQRLLRSLGGFERDLTLEMALLLYQLQYVLLFQQTMIVEPCCYRSSGTRIPSLLVAMRLRDNLNPLFSHRTNIPSPLREVNIVST